MTRLALIATILVVAASCDKARDVIADARSNSGTLLKSEEQLDLGSRPDVLFQVFGDRDDPRMIPIAAVVNGKLTPIALSTAGWRQFDAMYGRAGNGYSLYRDGAPAGRLQVRRGMWEPPAEELYSLPGCTLHTPLAAVTLNPTTPSPFPIEYLATTSGLSPSGRRKPLPEEAQPALARELAVTVARQSGVSRTALADSSFRATAIATGLTGAPTIVASFLDGGRTSANGSGHVFMLADSIGSGYSPTFRHVAPPASPTAEYRRFVDHIDLDGDSIDEVVLEAWRFGGDTYVIVLAHRDGEWREAFRGRPSWCLDEKAPAPQP